MEEDDGSELRGQMRVNRFFHTLLVVMLTAGACCLVGWVMSISERDAGRLERVMSMPFMDKAEVVDVSHEMGSSDGTEIELWLKYSDSSTVDGLQEALFWVDVTPKGGDVSSEPYDLRIVVGRFLERFPKVDRSSLRLLWCPTGAYMMKRGSLKDQNFSHIYGVYDPAGHMLLLDICAQ